MLNPQEIKSKNFKIFLGMPAYGGMVSAATTASLIDLQKWCFDNNVSLYPHFLTNESLITRARNEIVASMLDFEKFDASHLLFVDADIGFTPKNIERLLCSEKDVVCGIYPSKRIYWDRTIDAIKKNPDISIEAIMHRSLNYNISFHDRKNVQIENGFCKVKEAATGMMMVKKNVFYTLQKHYPERKYIPYKNYKTKLSENCYDFFSVGVYDKKENHYLSEDYFFSRLWQDCGGEIWADYSMPLVHHGTHQFRGHVGSLFNKD